MKRSLLDVFLESTGVCIDSRKVYPGCLFFALRGANFNGNEFINQALQDGAIAAVCDDPKFAVESCFIVNDCLKSLQDLAIQYRKTLNIPILALTGSNGKTTTKELLGLIFQKKYRVSMTRGNLNNHIGVPLTILDIPGDASFVIVEMGANHQKEIALLASIAQPTFGLITNIGSAHLEGFGSKEGIAKGKFELFDFLIGHQHPILYRRGAYKLEEMVGNYPNAHHIGDSGFELNGVTYKLDIKAVNPSITFDLISDSGVTAFSSCLYGQYNLENIVMAIYAGLYYGVGIDDISDAVSTYIPDNNRSQVLQWRGASIYLDAYNANPDSMKLAIESFAESADFPRMLILGEMKELGNYSIAEHQKILEQISRLNFDEVHLFGSEWSHLDIPAAIKHHTEFDRLKSYLSEKEWNQYHILIKGSRSNQLERLLIS